MIMNIKEIQSILNEFIDSQSPIGHMPSVQRLIDDIGLDYKITEDDRVVDVIALIQIHISKLILNDYIENVRNVK